MGIENPMNFCCSAKILKAIFENYRVKSAKTTLTKNAPTQINKTSLLIRGKFM